MTEPPLATQPSLGHPFGGATAELRFVGRAEPFAQLVAALPRGTHAVKLVTGDAGIGKSRLVAEVVAEAKARGHRVLRGVCWDAEGAPPFSPWIQVAQTLLRDTGDTDIDTDLGALLLDDPAASRIDLFNAVADALQLAQETTPLVVVLEDLHEADQPSLALLQFLVKRRQSQRILFIGTYRQGEVRDTAVDEQLSSIGTPSVRIDLSGLSASDLRLLIPENGPDSQELHAITGGNPLFVEQVLRLWLTRGDHRATRGFAGVTTDSSLRSVTRSRLEQLPATSRNALSAIAVHGRPITLTDLALLLGEPPEQVSADLAPSIGAGVLVASPHTDDRSDIAFAHVLLANAAVELTPPDRLRALHHRCAETLATRTGRAAERAHHLLQAGTEYAADALAACESAGDEAMVALAFEDAVSHYHRALSVIDLFGAGDAKRRMFAVINLGTAQWAAGDYADADASFTVAWDEATQLGDPHGLALAALGPGFRFDFTGDAATERALRCTIALDALPESPSPIRARLTATLAAAQLVEADQAVGKRTAERAIVMADHLGDERAIGYALIAQIVTDLDPDTLDRRLSDARRVLAIARVHGDRELAANGFFLLLAALLEAGDIRAIDVALDPRDNVVDTFIGLRDSRHAGWFRCSRTLLDGNAELAEQFANSSFDHAQRHHDPDAHNVWVAQISIARWIQGRASELETYYLQARREEPQGQVWTAVLAWLWATQGRLDEAAHALESIGQIADIPRDRHWFLTMSALSEVASIVGDKRTALELRDALIRYGSRLVPIGLGIAAWGTVARPLGLLARLLGRNDEAISHFRQSVQVCTLAGAVPWLVESQLDLAEALHDASDGHPPIEAVALARQAHATVNERDLEGFLPRAEATLNSLNAVPLDAVPPVTLAQGELVERDSTPLDSPVRGSQGGELSTRAAIIVMGRFHVTAADGSVPHWTSRKARTLLQLLVAARGAAVSRERMMDVLWPGEVPSALSNRMSVAISTVRRALDPTRIHPPQYFLRAERSVLQLNHDHVDIDVELFLQTAVTLVSHPEEPRDVALSHAIELYTGEVFADEPYEEWAQQLRHEARNTFAALCRLRAESASLLDNPLLAAQMHRRVLGIDPYDEHSHLGLIAALESLGVEGQARLAHEQYLKAMSELAS